MASLRTEVSRPFQIGDRSSTGFRQRVRLDAEHVVLRVGYELQLGVRADCDSHNEVALEAGLSDRYSRISDTYTAVLRTRLPFMLAKKDATHDFCPSCGTKNTRSPATRPPVQHRDSKLKSPTILAWMNVILYLTAGILFANNYGWDRALRIYTGFDFVTKGWYEDVLIRPTVFWVSLALALLLTKRSRDDR